VTEHLRVRSVVGRFLEHSRVFVFCAGLMEKVWISSADWLTRNLHRRVETCVPIEDPMLKRRVIDEGIDRLLADTSDAWELGSDGQYRAVAGAPSGSAQAGLIARLALKRP